MSKNSINLSEFSALDQAIINRELDSYKKLQSEGKLMNALMEITSSQAETQFADGKNQVFSIDGKYYAARIFNESTKEFMNETVYHYYSTHSSTPHTCSVPLSGDQIEDDSNI